ncbi:hypothetical protein ACLESD_42510, partial [Pyxidicoccus sp. 3LFB2]
REPPPGLDELFAGYDTTRHPAKPQPQPLAEPAPTRADVDLDEDDETVAELADGAPMKERSRPLSKEALFSTHPAPSPSPPPGRRAEGRRAASADALTGGA